MAKRRLKKKELSLATILHGIRENLEELPLWLEPVLREASKLVDGYWPHKAPVAKTGAKRKKSGDFLANLERRGPFSFLRNFDGKDFIARCRRWSRQAREQALHTLNLPSRYDLIRLHQQIEALDEKLASVQARKNLPSRASGSRNAGEAVHTGSNPSTLL